MQTVEIVYLPDGYEFVSMTHDRRYRTWHVIVTHPSGFTIGCRANSIKEAITEILRTELKA